MNEPTRSRGLARAVRTGWILLAVALPLGATLEVLLAFKAPGYLESALRRELWRLAHAHGAGLGLLLLVFSALAPRHLAPAAAARVARELAFGAVLLPLGFFLGGVLNHEGDPSLGILLVPLGALFLLVALVRAAAGTRARG
jgi:hypothetical protein